jgi:sec-independent protein translocase protein TatA
MGLSVTKLLLILLIVLLVFGAGKLPKIMGDLGKGMKALRDGLKDEDPTKQVSVEMHVPVKETPKQPQD